MTIGFLKNNDGKLAREPSILDVVETSAPGYTSGVGKFYASSVDNKPHFVSGDNQDYDLTTSSGSLWTDSGGDTIYPSTSDRFLGLGTITDSDYGIHMEAEGSAGSTLFVSRLASAGNPSYLRLYSANGTVGSPTAKGDDEGLGSVVFGGYNGSAYDIGSLIMGVSDGIWSGSNSGSYLRFDVTANGSTTNLEKMRLTSAGNLGIQTSAPGGALGIKDANTYIDRDGSNNMTFTDSVTGTKTLFELAEVGTRVDNTDVDQPSEVIDSFADTICSACYWHYVMSNGTNYRSGLINACWNATTNAIQYRRISTDDIGDTSDVVLSVDISSDNVRLIATVASDNWSVRTKRFFIDD